MSADLYALSYFAALLTLLLWNFFRESPRGARWLQGLFFAASGLYLLQVILGPTALPAKFLLLTRDLLLAGVLSVGFAQLRRERGLFWGAFGLLVGLVAAFGFRLWSDSFVAPRTEEPIPLDPSGELLLELEHGYDIRSLEETAQRYGLRFRPAFEMEHPEWTDLDDYFVVDVPDDRLSELKAIEKELLAHHLVEWVEPNELIQVAPLPTEGVPQRRSPIRGLNDPGVSELWGFEAMGVAELIQLMRERGLKPRKKALIAILDTGVDAEHEDLKDNYRSLDPRYDRDKIGHGTHCAGIAAAVSNNGKGIASFSPDNGFVEVTSVKVLNDQGWGNQRGIVNGMLKAVDRGADVLSMSLGGRSNPSLQRVYRQAVEYARKGGAIVVVAAGNSNTNARNFAPANVRGVITVAAVDTLLQRAGFSNYVSDLEMGIAAPGVKIYSTVPANRYLHYNGTSMATPYVAGLVGLMKSLDPDLSTEAAYRILQRTGRQTRNTSQTGKLIQPARAVERVLRGKR